MALPIGRAQSAVQFLADSMPRNLNVLGEDSAPMKLLGHEAVFSKRACHVFIDLYFAVYFFAFAFSGFILNAVARFVNLDEAAQSRCVIFCRNRSPRRTHGASFDIHRCSTLWSETKTALRFYLPTKRCGRRASTLYPAVFFQF